VSRPRSEAERRFDAHVGRHISTARKAQGMTRVRLARALGIDHRRLYWMETGGRWPFFMTVEIARVLGMNLSDLARFSYNTRKTEESLPVRADSVVVSKPF